jgi:flagellar basal-body rod modification protein FlgD
MASAVNPITSSVAANGAASAASAATSAAPTKEMFLQLLVAQIKNQDPLNPTDSVQFVSQLAQFSELEQVIAIRQDIESTAAAGTAQTPSASSNPSTGASAAIPSAAPLSTDSIRA